MTEKIWEKINVIYVGKSLKKKSNPDAEKQWKLWTVNFKLKPDDKYEKHASCFDSVNGIELLSDDNQGEILTFNCLLEGYNNTHGRQMSRSIKEVTFETGAQPTTQIMTRDKFYDTDNVQDETNTVPTPKVVPSTVQDKNTVLSGNAPKIKEFVKEYVEKLQSMSKDTIINESHCAMTYMAILYKYGKLDKFLTNLPVYAKKFSDEFAKYNDDDLGIFS